MSGMGHVWNDSDGFTFFESEEALGIAVAALRAMAPPTRRLLAQCIEHQEVVRAQASGAARALESAGFVFISDVDGYFSSAVRIKPTLAGEEAMIGLECLSQGTKQGRSQT
jgi:hypothetical protein